MASVDERLALDVRVGTIVSAARVRGARRPSLALGVAFGAAGRRTAVVDGAGRDDPGELVGLQVVGVLNLPPRRVAGVDTDARVLSVEGAHGERALLLPERPVPDGTTVDRSEDQDD